VTSDKGSAEITYSGEESYGKLYLAAVEGSSTGVAGIPVMKDNQVMSVEDKNLIVVGGSCINNVAATLLGVPEGTCGEAFTAATGVGAGQYLLKVVESPYSTGKVAMLVAGYEAEDTTKAATYVVSSSDFSTEAGNQKIMSSAAQGTVA
jgi:hypothetical protein